MTGDFWVQARTRLPTRSDASLIGAGFLLVSALLGLLCLALPGFVRPGHWRLAFTGVTVVLALSAVAVLRIKWISLFGILASILVIDGMIVLSGACLNDRSGGRVVVELFALPSLYLGLYAAAWMMIPQAVAVGAGAFSIMVTGGRFDAMSVTGTGTILVSVFTPALAVLVLRRRLVAALRQAKALATTDPLTGLANRRAIVGGADGLVQRALAGDLVLGVVVADVDHFKRINDVHGHAVGDEVLRLVAQAVRSCVGPSDVVVRLGGEEIAVITVTIPDDLADLAERIRQEVVLVTHRWPVTVSLGVAWADRSRLSGDPLPSVWGLVDEADDRMYAAKRAGRNQVVLPPILLT